LRILIRIPGWMKVWKSGSKHFCPEPDFTANDGKKWYLDDVVFKVSVKDSDAGIRSVRIKINGTDIAKDIEGNYRC